MNKKKAEKIISVYNWIRLTLFILLFAFLCIGVANAQTVDERVAALEQMLKKEQNNKKYMPQMHGILRGKYEYQHEMEAGRFEVHNARLAVTGKMALKSEYKLDAGIFNGSNLDNQKTAWFTSPGYSARLQYFPTKALAIVPSVQHQQIAERKASYTSVDIGAYYEAKGLHLEAECLHKMYGKDAFDDCNAVNAMAVYKQKIKNTNSFLECISYLGRYDWMQDHSSGKSGMAKNAQGDATNLLAMTDSERHRMTLGTTFSLRNPYFPTDIRLNYEKYWYPHGGAKDSEQDKLVCELMIRF